MTPPAPLAVLRKQIRARMGRLRRGDGRARRDRGVTKQRTRTDAAGETVTEADVSSYLAP